MLDAEKGPPTPRETKRWRCRSCSGSSSVAYRYPSSPSAYCDLCGEALPPEERLATAMSLLASRMGSKAAPHTTRPQLSGEFLTVSEAARLLRASPKAIYSLVERGRLPGVLRCGRRILLRRSELIESLSGNRAPSPERNRR